MIILILYKYHSNFVGSEETKTAHLLLLVLPILLAAPLQVQEAPEVPRGGVPLPQPQLQRRRWGQPEPRLEEGPAPQGGCRREAHQRKEEICDRTSTFQCNSVTSKSASNTIIGSVTYTNIIPRAVINARHVSDSRALYQAQC